MRNTTLQITVLVLFALHARADLLVLDNGDVLSGSALRVVEGALVFRTSLQGQMMAPMDTVHALSTDDNFAVGFADGLTRYGKLAQRDTGTVLLPLDGGDAVPVTLATITEAEKIPQTARQPEDTTGMAVSLEGGARARVGTSDAVAPFARLELKQTKPQRSTEAAIALEAAGDDLFPAYLEAEAAWRFQTQERRQPYVAVGLERDTGNALDLRTDVSLGLGRVLIQRDTIRLEMTAALNAAYEEWDPDGVDGNSGGEATTGSELNLRLGLRYARTLFGKVAFTNELDLYPALSDPGDFRARNATELSYPLTDRLRLRLDFRVDYDNAPGLDGLDEWNGGVGAGVSVDF